MYRNALLLLSVTGAALAAPQPQDDTSSFDGAAFSASLSSELASITAGALPGIYSDMPTLAPSIESFLATVVPTGTTEDPCATTEPAWLKNLPSSVKSALSSYDSAMLSWESKHSSELSTTFTAVIPTITAAEFCATHNGGSGPTPTQTGGAGGQTTAAAGSSNTAKGSAASGTNSSGRAAKPTGVVAAGFAGVVGMVGLMVAL